MRKPRDILRSIPDGAAVLFFIQIFATIGFAVLYSTLVLYTREHLHFEARDAAAIMGVFGAFNYGLHLFGGYLGGRFLSNRNLFVGGMLLQVLGCACISGDTLALLYWGLALFLTGSGLNVTCINMMLTQRFAAADTRRESAFLWNYAGMNAGFFIGFAVAGHYQLSANYPRLFVFATIGSLIAIALALANWRTLADRSTPLLEATADAYRWRLTAGVAILLGLVPLVWMLLQHPDSAERLIKGICVLVGVALVRLTLRHEDARERNNMWAFLILALGSLVFWALYQMQPNGLQTFAVRNVELQVWGVRIAPQWVQNINTVVIVLGGPAMAALFGRLRARGHQVDLPRQFALALILMGAGFLALPVGILLADSHGQVAFAWLFLNFVLQSLAELLISPVGYAMVGRLAPRRHQGVMMGSWMLVTGLASLIAGDLSASIPLPAGSTPLSTNPAYSTLFTSLGAGTVLVGLVLAALVPFLRRLIRDAAPPS